MHKGFIGCVMEMKVVRDIMHSFQLKYCKGKEGLSCLLHNVSICACALDKGSKETI